MSVKKLSNSTRSTSRAFKKGDIKYSNQDDDPHLKSFLKSTDIDSSTTIKNGLADAIGYSKNNFTGPGPNSCNQLSQLDTLFINNRWYLISNYRQLLSEIYVEHGLIKTIVDLPVDDALRGGIDITTNQLDEEQIKILKNYLKTHNDIKSSAQAVKWNRLYGGSAILIITGQDSQTPLDVEALADGEKLEFKAIDMWELFYDKLNVDDDSMENQGLGINIDNCETYNYYNKVVHKSRVIIMKGLEAPSFIRPRLRGWGVSIVEDLVRGLNQYLKANNLSFELLDELKIDVFKFDGYNATRAGPNGDEKIIQRTSISNYQKNYQNALVMDSKDDFSQKELSLNFLPETMNQIRIQIAADFRIPITKLFGISSAGFNSGEDEIENYNGMIVSEIRTPLELELLKVIKLRCLNIFGFIPDDLEIEFKPLRVLSSEQEENVKTQQFNRILQARQAGEIDSIEFKEACNRGKLLPIQLDTTKDKLNIAAGSSDGQKNIKALADKSSDDDSNSKPSKEDAIDVEITKNNNRSQNIYNQLGISI